MIFLTVDEDETKNTRFGEEPDCRDFLQVYPEYYKNVGYDPPWVGYFIANNNNELIGCGAFKGKPKNNRVEIAYGVFPKYNGKGIATEICRQLITIAMQQHPGIIITAKTLPETNASTSILKKNGFVLVGNSIDEEDGEVWDWELNNS